MEKRDAKAMTIKVLRHMRKIHLFLRENFFVPFFSTERRHGVQMHSREAGKKGQRERETGNQNLNFDCLRREWEEVRERQREGRDS